MSARLSGATPSLGWLATAIGAHATAIDPSNRFAFVPHIARLNDNVLDPPKENPGSNMILQFQFDAPTGRLTANSPFGSSRRSAWPPATIVFIPPWISSIFPTSSAESSRPTVWKIRPAPSPRCGRSRPCPTGTPHGTPAPRYTSRPTEHLTSIGHVTTEAVSSAFSLDPAGSFVFAAGTASGRLASYRISGETGALTPLATQAAGQRPAAVLITPLGD